MRAALSLAALSLSAGCQLLVGIDDFEPGVPEEVSGTAQISYFTGTARVELPEDWSGATLSAYTVAPSGELVAHAALTSSDGSFTIAIPPDREHYYLRIQREGEPDQIYRLVGRSLDLTTDVARRPDLGPPATSPSQLSLTLEGMPPRESMDYFAAYAPGVRGSLPISFLENGPADGATRIASASFDWAGGPLLRGEALWVTQQRPMPPTPGVEAYGGYAVATAHVPSLQQTQGATLPAAGAFTAGAPRTLPYAVDLPALRRLPGAYASDSLSLSVSAAPDGGLDDSAERVLTWSYSMPARRARRDYSIVSADPFPAAWARTATATYYRIRRMYTIDPLMGVFASVDVLQVGAHTTGPLAALPTLDGAPAVGVQHITVDGAPLDRVRVPDNRPVRLAWDPVPGAAHYRVTVMRYGTSGTGGAGSTGVVATLASAAPELVLPADLLPAEAKLAFYVSAIAAQALEPAPRRTAELGTTIGSISDLLYTSATCGNARPDPGEGCDSGGPSATCDFDCTQAVCGDGVHNAAAGEQCDLGTPSFFGPGVTCDAQCRLVHCGDGVVGGTETCDDGNTASGDGCSADCVGEP